MSHIEKEKLIKADIASIENKVRHAFNQGYELGFKDGKERAKLLEQEPKTGKWIPVSERLPEIRQHVLCQCRANSYSVLRLNHNGDWECIYPPTTYMQSFVIAWQPLPQPYKAGM